MEQHGNPVDETLATAAQLGNELKKLDQRGNDLRHPRRRPRNIWPTREDVVEVKVTERCITEGAAPLIELTPTKQRVRKEA